MHRISGEMGDNDKRNSYRPFGTSEHKPAFSEYAHLSATNRDFVLKIHESDPARNITSPSHLPDQSDKNHHSSIAKKAGGAPQAEALKPCLRPDCKQVIVDIKRTQEKNQQDREFILKESKRLVVELERVQTSIEQSESDHKQFTQDSSHVEGVLFELNEALSRLERLKAEQEKEKEELNNKVHFVNL